MSCAQGRLVNEGFCEDLARQTTVHTPALAQLSAGVVTVTCESRAVTMCYHIWHVLPHMGYVLSHMGHVLSHWVTCYHIGVFSRRCSVLKAYLGRRTACLGTSAHRPCFDLSVCLSVFNLSVYHLIANPIACASFPRLTHL